MKYRALTDLSLRQSKNPKDPKFGQWHEWPSGTVFEPPKHMNVSLSLERGIIEPTDGGPRAIPAIVEERPDDADEGEAIGGFVEEESDDDEE